MGIVFETKASLASGFRDLFKRQQYEIFVLQILNRSKTLIKNLPLEYVQEQSKGECDFKSKEKNHKGEIDKYDVKLLLDAKQGALIGERIHDLNEKGCFSSKRSFIVMRNYLGEFEVEELFEIKDIGVTMPVLCRLNSGITVVAKYMQNPFGEQVLINELIGSCIADMFNINIPEYGICNLSKNVIINTNFNEDM